MSNANKSEICPFVKFIWEQHFHIAFVAIFIRVLQEEILKLCFHILIILLKLKNELIEEAGYKIICFEEEHELAFFANKLPILTHSYCRPKEILFSIECSD